MENTTAKVVENKVAEKKEVKKFDRKPIAESIEKAFKADKRVDVIADTNKETPTALSYEDYRFIHFYAPGTEKDLFQLYISKKGAKFYMSLNAAEYLDKSVEREVSEKTVTNKNGEKQKKPILVIVKCSIEDISDVANKIIEAYANIPAKPKKEKPAKTETKAVEKQAEKKPMSKKQTIAKKPVKKATEKKAVNK